ncbi:TPA: hypothetical protein ACF9K4_002764 [Staphylococcus aureus]|uniref:hypothetical protein n=1 Tax=Staphylococcus TaxID=1279 RepID=UPI00044623F2|nr:MULTISPECIES: hypothetical protein [Staphylococcus]MDV0205721.1 hypothetical protein [Staphylococcus aureus]EUR16373.1 hypothetical protein T686_02744 [Staphylococcus aureus SJUD6056]MDK7754070.1 hypothetical protein [Staphylococcus sp. UMB10092B]CAC5966892.1 Uncharacterised protein [Staphylococcus aureus]HCZ9450663.1 hypothetical protein [Staphylococcus aureus]
MSIGDSLISIAQFLILIDLSIIILTFLFFLLVDKVDFIKVKNVESKVKLIAYVIVSILLIAIFSGVSGMLLK